MKHQLYCLDIYITNVCPNACNHCSTFNNLNFSGHMSWELNKPLLEKWAERCDFQDMGLLGGEPLIHPEYKQWVKGVREIFPNQKRLSVATGLYVDKLKNHVDNLQFAMDNRVRVEFNVHDPDAWDETCEFVETVFLKGLEWTKDTQSIEPGSIVWPDDDLHYYVDGETVCDVLPAWDFVKNPIKEYHNGKATFYDNDPVEVFANCELKVCHTYVDGRIYLCQNTAVGKMFAEQFEVDQRVYDLLTTSDSIHPNDSDEKIAQFILDLKKPCPQCSLCTIDGRDTVLIAPAPAKKIKLTKREDYIKIVKQ
jgi:hypothetical protein